ncbi:hypothetical protein [Rhodoplanes serenus]|uniref:hypothetical protein n=1 Tax=Rhodoplanes serenus TaxID=200615 RepID=UPI000DAB8381|nr:hypothetical protein [Rhodoplanes serenus]RAI34531.1 hypothetical protein CH340_08875 [Rhodoplanes serenus]
MSRDHTDETVHSADRDTHSRVWEDEVFGGSLEYPDGTIIRDGKVVKAGPRAIVGPDGTLIGMRPE